MGALTKAYSVTEIIIEIKAAQVHFKILISGKAKYKRPEPVYTPEFKREIESSYHDHSVVDVIKVNWIERSESAQNGMGWYVMDQLAKLEKICVHTKVNLSHLKTWGNILDLLSVVWYW